MTELFPIIRRKRRPLIVVDVPAAAVVAPVVAKPELGNSEQSTTEPAPALVAERRDKKGKEKA
jgi:hypothetical protein